MTDVKLEDLPQFYQLLEALNILKKYDSGKRGSTGVTAEHDEIWIYCGTAVHFKEDYDDPDEEWQEVEHFEGPPDPATIVSDEDMAKLKALGFSWDDQNEGWHTFV